MGARTLQTLTLHVHEFAPLLKGISAAVGALHFTANDVGQRLLV